MLRDDARRAVFDAHGYDGLARSEAYQAESVLDAWPGEVFEWFFKGEDPEDRDYLLTESLEQRRHERGIDDEAHALLSDVEDDDGDSDAAPAVGPGARADDDDDDDADDDDAADDDDDDDELPPECIRGCSTRERSARSADDVLPPPPLLLGMGLPFARPPNAAASARFGPLV